jgi:hypothetical protein
MRLVDAATLAAIGLVVLLVSLPRLEAFALRENEEDAVALVERLGMHGARERCASIRELVEGDTTLRRQLDDVEFLDGGRLLRRHGYLFEMLRAGPALDAGATVRAWPWRHRKTGYAAFAWTDVGVLGYPNSDGAWSGPDAAPFVDWGKWTKVTRP